LVMQVAGFSRGAASADEKWPNSHIFPPFLTSSVWEFFGRGWRRGQGSYWMETDNTRKLAPTGRQSEFELFGTETRGRASLNRPNRRAELLNLVEVFNLAGFPASKCGMRNPPRYLGGYVQGGRKRTAGRFRACFENISGGLAAGRAAGFVASRLQISANMRPRRASPSAPPARNPWPIYFQNTLLVRFRGCEKGRKSAFVRFRPVYSSADF